MKLTKILLATAIVGAMAFAASKASAFPLTLKAFNGTANTTAYYGPTNNPSATSNKIDKVSFNLKKILTVVTNELKLRGSNVPAAYTLMYDPFLNVTYLTNNLGYYAKLNGIVDVYFWDIATSFKGTANSGSENDVIDAELWVHNAHPPGSATTVDIDAWGAGTLTSSINSKGVVKM